MVRAHERAFEASVDLRPPAVLLFPSPWAAVNTSTAVISARAIDSNFKIPKTMHFNVGYEQQVGKSSSFTIGYVGATSRDLLVSNQGNLRIPEVVNGELFWRAGAPFAQPLLGRVTLLTSGARGHDHALQTDFETRFGSDGPFRRLRSKVSYTYSRNVDDFSQIQSSAANGSRGAPTIPLDVTVDRGLSAQHMSHLFSFNFTYDMRDLPLEGVMGAIFNHWTVSGITTLTSGLPINIITGFDRARTGQDRRIDRPESAPRREHQPRPRRPGAVFRFVRLRAASRRVRGQPRLEHAHRPGIPRRWISPVVRSFPVTAMSEGFNIQVRLEAFNLLNRANFGIPDNAVFNTHEGTVRGAAGQIVNTSAPNRQIQLGVRVEFEDFQRRVRHVQAGMFAGSASRYHGRSAWPGRAIPTLSSAALKSSTARAALA